jgi:hypothetical protein
MLSHGAIELSRLWLWAGPSPVASIRPSARGMAQDSAHREILPGQAFTPFFDSTITFYIDDIEFQ